MRKNVPSIEALFFPFALAVLFFAVLPRVAAAQTPEQIVARIVQNELSADASDHSRWMYRDAYKSPTKNTVKLIIQTPQGNLSEIIEDNGRPPSAQEHQADLSHMQQMISDPSLRERQQRNEQHDSDQATQLMKMLPKAFVWHLVTRNDGTITLGYHPNPSFSPPTMSSRVLAAMSGTMVVDERQMRLKALNGKLMQPVEFGWGFLGHLDAGGTFQIVRSEIAPREWQITQTHVHIAGHALFFKTIGDQEDEWTSDFRPVPDGVDIAKAAQMLRNGQVAHDLDTGEQARR